MRLPFAATCQRVVGVCASRVLSLQQPCGTCSVCRVRVSRLHSQQLRMHCACDLVLLTHIDGWVLPGVLRVCLFVGWLVRQHMHLPSRGHYLFTQQCETGSFNSCSTAPFECCFICFVCTPVVCSFAAARCAKGLSLESYTP